MTNNLAVSLLTHYSFDLGGYSASELVKRWENQYPSNWVHLAIIEALYQGRYKAVSAQQILTLWLKRNHPSYHFNMEFERLICNKLPEDLRWNNSLPPLPPALPSVSSSRTIEEVMTSYESQQRQLVSSYQENTESEQIQTTDTFAETDNYYTSAGIEAEENRSTRNASKLLPTSSSMVFVPASESSTSIVRSTESRTLTEARSQNRAVINSKLMEFQEFKKLKQAEESEESEKPLTSETMPKLLPPERNHPPIEQFTPEQSDSSDTFTSKLKGVMG
ncbi:hypothetical protein [Rivularia sp. PCC 7116]|uniref:hypothetical protein n=1 Tax=Rivularia sp. PCC 7116 TaxID=373994 RepID=UPI001E2D0D45|nr:hypothetical protein [Rivularia sp. PCC 7116]